MQLWLVVTGLAALLAAAIHRYLIQPLLRSPLKTIPLAHPLCGVTHLYFQYLAKQGRELNALHAAHKRYGPIVGTAPNEVSVISLEGLRQIYTSCTKTDFYHVFANFNTPNMVSMLDHKSHSAQKKILSGIYSKSYLQHSEDVARISKIVICARLLPLLEHLVGQGRSANVYRLMQFVGIDFQTAFQFGVERSTRLVEYHGHEGVHYSTKDVSVPYDTNDPRDHDLLPEDEILEMCKATLSSQHKDESNTTDPIVFEKLYSSLKDQDSLGKDSSNDHDENTILRTASELRDHIIAAQETTAITLTYTLYHLSQRPDLQSALRHELSTLAPGVHPSPPDLDSPPPSSTLS
ncbi:Cytochrome P450 monooxygenase FGM1 [Fulvia fulva]|uniref:Cytochrome P450 monooxygenase FGM1 n=1 Tax=Passalora fulva TaxID=5499 RepID=A0A9Q8UWM3_PASFU|nr:Cytochrome P450 monooxygenase FGM1 [Fulvia fulva]UJO25166.1 Cytochrome P450 monooxygenase FGM1 [Fulvia fulva]